MSLLGCLNNLWLLSEYLLYVRFIVFNCESGFPYFGSTKCRVRMWVERDLPVGVYRFRKLFTCCWWVARFENQVQVWSSEEKLCEPEVEELIKYNIIVSVVTEDVGRVKKISQDELWFAIWCPIWIIWKAHWSTCSKHYNPDPNHYLRMSKARDGTLGNP